MKWKVLAAGVLACVLAAVGVIAGILTFGSKVTSLRHTGAFKASARLYKLADHQPVLSAGGTIRSPSTMQSLQDDAILHAARQQRCNGTTGTWCMAALTQVAMRWKDPPEHSKACGHDCNGVGVCSHDTGLCLCPAGWAGEDCMQRQKRPCTNRWRTAADDPQEPYGLMPDPWKEPGWTASRCAGTCDDDIAACFCPSNSTFGRIPAPEGSDPGTPPIQRGRPMILDGCQPSTVG